MINFLLLNAFFYTATASYDVKIVGGSPTSIQRIPYQARLENSKGLWCGASILTKYHVLTAAHCLAHAREPLTVHTGTGFLNQPGNVHRIARNAVFGNKNDSDVAVLRVIEPIIFNVYCKPIKLAAVNEEPRPGTIAVATGWGLTNENGASNQLLSVSIPITSREICNKIYSGSVIHGITLGQICAGDINGGHDTCSGDSGGPLTVNGRQVGIISMGYGCARRNKPGIYTNVAYYSQWIVKQTQTL